MKTFKTVAAALGLVVPLALAGTPASAEDTLKLVIGQINNWENQAPTLGQDAGIFKKHGLVLENTGTQGAGETIQAVISGSADIGAGVGAAGAMRAFSKGAPVRILAPMFTGTGDLYWYVKSDSKIKSLKDATPETTIAYSTNGSSSNNIVVAFISELGAKAKPTATGGPAATLTAVMSGQVDIGWAAPPFGLQEIKDGKIRIVAHGSDVPSLRGQTVRTLIVNANALKTKHDAIMRFMDGLSRGGGLDVFRSEGGRDVFRQDQAAGRTAQGVDGQIPAEGGAADRSVCRSRRRHPRRGQAEIPGEAADQGADRGVDADSAAQEISRARVGLKRETGRCLAAARFFAVQSLRRRLHLLHFLFLRRLGHFLLAALLVRFMAFLAGQALSDTTLAPSFTAMQALA